MLIFFNYFFAGMQLLFCTYTLLLEYKRKSVGFFLWAMLFIIWALPHFVSCIFIRTVYSLDVLLIASLFSCFFSILYLIVRGIIKYRVWFNLQEYINSDITKVSKLLFYFFCFIMFLQLFNVYRYAGSFGNTSWELRREMSLQNGYLSYDRIISYCYYFSSGVFLIFLLKKDLRHTIISFTILLFGVFISRIRADLLPLIISILSFFILRNDKLTVTKIFAICIISVIFLYSVFAFQVFRYGGSIFSFLDNVNWFDFNALVWERIFSGEGDLGSREAFYYFISHDNKFENFGAGHTYIRMLLLFLPTQWSFGIKPPDFAISMGMAWMPEAGGGFSMHPTLLGDCYANFGFLGVIGGAFWAFIVNNVDKLIRKFSLGYKIPCFVACSSCFVLIGRGSVYNGFVVMVYSLLIMLILECFSRIRFNK